MIDDRCRRRIEAAKDLAAQTDSEGERNAALAAVERMEANQPTKAIVRRKELLDHQRRAWLCLASGGGRLSKSENSFLHNIRERRTTPTTAQSEWLHLIEVRIQWEKSL